MNKKQMIDSVRSYLSSFGDVDERILNAMNVVDRAKFYSFGKEVYDDSPKPIGKGQTISQPSCVGRMLSLLELEKTDYVLEVGAGSGWMASLISYFVKFGKVLTLDIHDELIEMARKNSAEFGLDKNLIIENQNFLDLVENFDKIIFSCGILKKDEEKITRWIKKHLNEDGRAVVPFKEGPLIVFVKDGNDLKKEYTKEEYRFVPLFL